MIIIPTQQSTMKLQPTTTMKPIRLTKQAIITKQRITTRWHTGTHLKRTVITSMPRRSILRLIATNTLSTVNTDSPRFR